jgi:hypothetical protein
MAGQVIVGWSPVAGWGTYIPTNAFAVNFTTTDASVGISYDPDDPVDPDRPYVDLIDVDTGTPGHHQTFLLTAIWASPTGVVFEGDAGMGGSVEVDTAGNPGPVNDLGVPVSADSLAHEPMGVVVQMGYHDTFSFTGSSPGAVPEPPGGVLAAVAAAMLAAVGIYRRR